MDREVTKPKAFCWFLFLQTLFASGIIQKERGELINGSVISMLFLPPGDGEISNLLFCPRNRQKTTWGRKKPLGSTVSTCESQERRGAGSGEGRGGHSVNL